MFKRPSLAALLKRAAVHSGTSGRRWSFGRRDGWAIHALALFARPDLDGATLFREV